MQSDPLWGPGGLPVVNPPSSQNSTFLFFIYIKYIAFICVVIVCMCVYTCGGCAYIPQHVWRSEDKSVLSSCYMGLGDQTQIIIVRP